MVGDRLRFELAVLRKEEGEVVIRVGMFENVHGWTGSYWDLHALVGRSNMPW